MFVIKKLFVDLSYTKTLKTKIMQQIISLSHAANELLQKAIQEDLRITHLLKVRVTLEKYGLEKDKKELLDEIDKSEKKLKQLLAAYKDTLKELLKTV